MPFEFEDQRPPGERPRDAQRDHGGLGARARQDHLFGAWHDRGDHLGSLDLETMLRSEHRPARGLARDRVHDHWRGVSEDERAVAQHEIDVAVAVDVPQVGTLAALEVHGMGQSSGARDRGHSPRDHAAGAFVELLRAGQARVGDRPHAGSIRGALRLGRRRRFGRRPCLVCRAVCRSRDRHGSSLHWSDPPRRPGPRP